MEAEMGDHLGYQKSHRSASSDYRNGYKSSLGLELYVPTTNCPQTPKDISSIDQKIVSMHAKEITTRQISETLEDIYGFGAPESFISDVTDKILPQIEDWKKRPLSEVYPVLYSIHRCHPLFCPG